MLTLVEQEILKKYKNKSYFSLHLNVVAAILAYIFLVYVGVTSDISDILIVPLIAYVCLSMFVLAHESIHNRANKLVGIVFGLLMLVNFYATKHSHLLHHEHTNKKNLDPENIHPKLKAVPIVIFTLLGTPFRWFSVIMSFFPNASKKVRILNKPLIFVKDRHNNTSSKLTVALEFFIIALSFVYGFTKELLLFWLIPGSISVSLVALFFIYLPHRDLPSDNNFVSVRIFNNDKKWVRMFHWSVVFNACNYHGTHHAYPSIMAMHLPAVTKELKGVMREKGVSGL